MIIATAGHIDHGKTTLVAALTGVDTDRLPEEKTRGMTIDLGFAYAPVDGGPVLGFVDVPGHEKFIRNMLAGVTGIDFALLIIAADDGPMAQTEEHLAILDLLGIGHGAVALTKTDAVDAARLQEVGDEIDLLLAGTVLDGAPVFPVSGITGDGVADLRAHLDGAAKSHHMRSRTGHFRHAVDRCFTVTGSGLVVTGTAFAGNAKVGDQLMLSPSGLSVRVRAIHAQNTDSDTGVAGQRLGINITGSGLSRDRVHRGDWLLAQAAHAPTDRLDARLSLLKTEKKPLRHWTPVHLHLGAIEVTARVAVLAGKNIPPGGSGLVQLVLDKPIGALARDKIVLRDHAAQRTLGGGHVIDPFPPKRGRARPQRLELLQLLDTDDDAAAFAALAGRSLYGFKTDQFARARNLDAAGLAAVLDGVPHHRAGGLIVGPDRWRQLTAAALQAATQAHAAKPDEPGFTEDSLRRAVDHRLDGVFFRGVLDDLEAAGSLKRSGASYALPGHTAEMTPADAKLWQQVEPLLVDGNFKPPIVRELADALGLDHVPVGKFLMRAEKLGLVLRVADNRYYLTGPIAELAELAQALAEANAGVLSVIAFRDHAEIGRNLAVNVLEYFDKAGFTKRAGDARRIVRPAAEVF
ncbi:MAG: selenocysteine-specific translation elongation factor [Rhodospirillales bacterium]|nr:selenocysteine-specific translation elongation factor [Rhodospirillales bacterium]